jgi:hypothetical protein
MALAVDGPLAGGFYPHTHGCGALACLRRHQVGRRQGGHFHMQIDAVKQRAAEFALIARHLVGCAAAGFDTRTQIAARAGVHGCHQLKLRGKFGVPRCA